MNEPSPFKTLSSRIAYKNAWMKIREDSIIRPDGSKGIYGVIETRDSVIIVCTDDHGAIGFVRVYRYPVQKWCWELPGGGGDDQEIIVASKRELAEEAGVSAEHWQILGRTRVGNGLMTEYQASVLATGLTFDKATDTQEGISGLSFFSLEEIDRMIDAGDIDDGQSLTALYLYKKWLASQNKEEKQT